jgi:hypothetical protein
MRTEDRVKTSGELLEGGVHPDFKFRRAGTPYIVRER